MVEVEKTAEYYKQKQIKDHAGSAQTETSNPSNHFEEKPGSHDPLCKPKNWSR